MRPTRALPASLLILAVAPLGACSTAPDLAGRTFVADTATGHELVADSRLVLAFTDDAVGTQAGCNATTSAATWDDGTLHLTGDPESTDLACADDLEAQDEWLRDLLAGEPTLTLDDQTLTVASGDVTLTLVETT